MTQHFKSKGGQWASFARNRNRMAKFAKGATSFQRLLYIISIRLFNLFNQAIETYMIKRQFLEIKLACRAIQLRLICIPRQLIFLKWSNVTNDPMSQMIQCLKWSNNIWKKVSRLRSMLVTTKVLCVSVCIRVPYLIGDDVPSHVTQYPMDESQN